MDAEHETFIYKEALDTSPIIMGKRGPEFKDFISRLVARGKLTEKYINVLTGPEGMNLYSMVFTNSSADPVNNYEMMEMVGDSTCNKCLVWYFFYKYPHLNNKEGVKTIAKLKIFYAATKTFFMIAEKERFMPFISARENRLHHLREKTMEDCFEAFFGATEYLLNTYVREGVGYAICYEIFKSFFDELKIETRYYKLIDNITKLKELVARHPYYQGGKIMNVAYNNTGFAERRATKLAHMDVFVVFQDRRRVKVDKRSADKNILDLLQRVNTMSDRYFQDVKIIRVSYAKPNDVILTLDTGKTVSFFVPRNQQDQDVMTQLSAILSMRPKDVMEIEYAEPRITGLVNMDVELTLDNGKKVIIGKGSASKGPVAKQKAAQDALRRLKQMGITRSYENPPENDDFEEIKIVFN
jgi:dsRNA-specific ribonuclease